MARPDGRGAILVPGMAAQPHAGFFGLGFCAAVSDRITINIQGFQITDRVVVGVPPASPRGYSEAPPAE